MWDFENNPDVIGLGNGFLDMTSKEQVTKEKVNQTPSQFKNCLLQRHCKEKATTEHKTNFVNYMSGKGWIIHTTQ